jgi:hypothetical protein
MMVAAALFVYLVSYIVCLAADRKVAYYLLRVFPFQASLLPPLRARCLCTCLLVVPAWWCCLLRARTIFYFVLALASYYSCRLACNSK